MRVKVGNIWHEPTPGNPICIHLSESDKRNIANVHQDAFKYAIFHDDEKTTADEKREWMSE